MLDEINNKIIYETFPEGKDKREYAKSHNIELMEIWYWDKDKINEILSNKLNINNIEKLA